MRTKLNGRDVTLDEIEFGEDPCDSFAQVGYFDDTGEELNDAELDELNNSTDFTEAWYEHQVSRAEYMRDMSEDR